MTAVVLLKYGLEKPCRIGCSRVYLSCDRLTWLALSKLVELASIVENRSLENEFLKLQCCGLRRDNAARTLAIAFRRFPSAGVFAWFYSSTIAKTS